MEKNFLNITPESGNGNQEVTINAKANISLEDREEMLRIRSSTGKEASVRIIQECIPFIASVRLRYQNVVPRISTKKVYINISQTYNIGNTDLNSDEKDSIIPYVREEINIEGTQFYWIDAGSMDPIMQGNHETTIGLGYFLDRVELIQLHKERFHLYLS